VKITIFKPTTALSRKHHEPTTWVVLQGPVGIKASYPARRVTRQGELLAQAGKQAEQLITVAINKASTSYIYCTYKRYRDSETFTLCSAATMSVLF
jgi:hypothetical protein